MKLNEIIHQYSWHMPPSSSDPLLSSLLISGEFVPLSGWSLCQSSGWLVERWWANRKAFSSHTFLPDSLIIFHDDAAHLNRWHTWLLSDVLHVRRFRERPMASSGPESYSRQALCLICLSLASRTSIKARHCLNQELLEAVVLWKQGWLLSRLQVIWALRKALNHTRPIKWGNAVKQRLNSVCAPSSPRGDVYCSEVALSALWRSQLCFILDDHKIPQGK